MQHKCDRSCSELVYSPEPHQSRERSLRDSQLGSAMDTLYSPGKSLSQLLTGTICADHQVVFCAASIAVFGACGSELERSVMASHFVVYILRVASVR